ncbi:hypothetical protein K438DRAFT_2096857 [Mycena galopus ATCC 62051]|nr:hypothetical protein K438DRAFT_2096857 [Mycena galopus ATCC 62051]
MQSTGEQGIYEIYDTRGEISGWKMERNDKEKCAQQVRGVVKRNLPPSKNNGDKEKSTNNRRKAQPHPDDDELLQDDEEQLRASQNHVVVRGGIELVLIYERWTTTGEAAGYAACTNEGGETKTSVSGNACLAFSRYSRKCHYSVLLQQDQDSSKIADVYELHMKKCNTQSMLHQTQRARAQTPDGTPPQQVARVEEGWGDVRASTGKRGTTTQGLRISLAKRHPSHAGKCPLRRTSRTETRKREPPKFRIPTIEKQRKKKQAKNATHAQNSCLPPP